MSLLRRSVDEGTHLWTDVGAREGTGAVQGYSEEEVQSLGTGEERRVTALEDVESSGGCGTGVEVGVVPTGPERWKTRK